MKNKVSINDYVRINKSDCCGNRLVKIQKIHCVGSKKNYVSSEYEKFSGDEIVRHEGNPYKWKIIFRKPYRGNGYIYKIGTVVRWMDFFHKEYPRRSEAESIDLLDNAIMYGHIDKTDARINKILEVKKKKLHSTKKWWQFWL